jgi:hypothetical protein
MTSRFLLVGWAALLLLLSFVPFLDYALHEPFVGFHVRDAYVQLVLPGAVAVSWLHLVLLIVLRSRSRGGLGLASFGLLIVAALGLFFALGPLVVGSYAQDVLDSEGWACKWPH